MSESIEIENLTGKASPIRRRLLVGLVLTLALSAAGPWAQPQPQPQPEPQPEGAPDPAALLECARANWVGSSFHGVVRVEMFRPEYSRAYRLEIWAQPGGTPAFIRVLEPEEEAGSGYLQTEDELWFYTPQAGQAIPLPPSALSESFFGSDLALEDLYRGTLSAQYTAEWLGVRAASPDEAARPDDAVHRLALRPKPEASVVYGRLELEVRDSDCAVLLIDFYDQRETLIREARFLEFLTVGDRVVPTVTIVDDLLTQGSRTVETLETAEFDVDIPPERFTLACLMDESQCGSSSS